MEKRTADAIHQMFHFERKRLLKIHDDLILLNHSYGGTKGAYYFKSMRFTNVPPWSLKGKSIHPIHPALVPQAQDLLDAMDKLEADEKAVTQIATVIENRSKTTQDIRDCFPEPLVALMNLTGIPRIKNPGFLFEGTYMMNQFDKAWGIIDYYAANRLIY